MGRMVAGQDVDRAVGKALEKRRAIGGVAHRGVHLEIGVVSRPGREVASAASEHKNAPAVGVPEFLAAGDGGIRQGEVVGTGLSGEGQAALFGGAQQAHAAGRAQVLTMHARAGDLGQEDVPGHDQFLSGRRPAAQPQRGAPIALVHHPIGHQRDVLAMIQHRQVEHLRVLERAAHHLVVLHAMTVVGDGHDPRLFERPDRRQFFPGADSW